MKDQEFFKRSIPDLYKNSFFEICIWAWITAMRQEGKTIREGVESFQQFWGLDEDSGSLVTLSQSYRRKQEEYCKMRKKGRVELNINTVDQSALILNEIQYMKNQMQIIIQNRSK